MDEPNYQDTIARISEIDDMFESATGWGSWMVSAANDRERLVNYANNRWPSDVKLAHKYLARTASGGRVD